MAISTVSGQRSKEISLLPPVVRWSDFDFQKLQLNNALLDGVVYYQSLRGTSLSCIIEQEVARWENRKLFIEHVVKDIITNCPKNEPLVFISLGSDRLLTEYIMGKLLIENGFTQISFLLVDPAYAFSDLNTLGELKISLEDFRKNIEDVYQKSTKGAFPKEQIRYLSRSQNISKYFPPNANVVVVESLPPYSAILAENQKYKAPEKSPQDLLAGSYLVPPGHANTIALIPEDVVENISKAGAKLKSFLPSPLFKNDSSYSYIDWGCKIRSNGTYSLSFSGEDYYLKHLCRSLNIPPTKPIKLSSGETVQVGEWILALRAAIEKMLSQDIKSIKNDDPQKQLSQANITALLEKVQKVATLYLPRIHCFFSADYVVDREEAMNFIAAHAGHHYRKIFTLTADAETVYKISTSHL